MAVFIRNVISVLAVGSAFCNAALLTGTLVGVFAPSGNPLSDLALMAIDPNTAENSTIGDVTLGPLTQTFPAKSAFNKDTGEILVAASTSNGIYAFDTGNGKSTVVAAIAAYNESDPYLGLAYLDKNTYLVTQYGLWDVSDGALNLLAGLSGMPSVAQFTVNPSGGTNGAGQLFVGDTGNPAVYVIDLGNKYKVTKIKASGSGLAVEAANLENIGPAMANY